MSRSHLDRQDRHRLRGLDDGDLDDQVILGTNAYHESLACATRYQSTETELLSRRAAKRRFAFPCRSCVLSLDERVESTAFELPVAADGYGDVPALEDAAAVDAADPFPDLDVGPVRFDPDSPVFHSDRDCPALRTTYFRVAAGTAVLPDGRDWRPCSACVGGGDDG